MGDSLALFWTKGKHGHVLSFVPQDVGPEMLSLTQESDPKGTARDRFARI